MEATKRVGDRLTILYPKVDETDTPLPRGWSPKDKFAYLGLTHNNLRVHYKGTTFVLPVVYNIRQWKEPQGCCFSQSSPYDTQHLWNLLF